MVIERPWGTEDIFAQTPTYMGKILRRHQGTKGDLQSHLKHESHYLLHGRMRVTIIENGERIVSEKVGGDSWHVPAGVVHQEEALTPCVEIEVSEPTLNDRLVVEASPDAGLPSTTPQERLSMGLKLAAAYIARASEVLQQSA